jgi:Flp pilus assembly pilin Flp
MSASFKIGPQRSASPASAFVAFTHRFRRDQRGLTTVEYVMVLCLIAVVAVGTWKAFGEEMETYLRNSKTSIGAAMPPEAKAATGPAGSQ